MGREKVFYLQLKAIFSSPILILKRLHALNLRTGTGCPTNDPPAKFCTVVGGKQRHLLPVPHNEQRADTHRALWGLKFNTSVLLLGILALPTACKIRTVKKVEAKNKTQT